MSDTDVVVVIVGPSGAGVAEWTGGVPHTGDRVRISSGQEARNPTTIYQGIVVARNWTVEALNLPVRSPAPARRCWVMVEWFVDQQPTEDQ